MSVNLINPTLFLEFIVQMFLQLKLQEDFFYKVTASLAPHVVQGGRLDANNLQGLRLVGAVKSVEGKQIFFWNDRLVCPN